MYKVHHPKTDIDRLYVKRKEGGRGLVQVEGAYKAEITNIAEYLNTNYKVDPFVYFVKSFESTQPTMNSLIKTMTMCRNVCFVSFHCSYFKQYTSRMPGVKKPKECVVYLSIYLSGLVTAVAVFRNPNTIPFCLTTENVWSS